MALKDVQRPAFSLILDHYWASLLHFLQFFNYSTYLPIVMSSITVSVQLFCIYLENSFLADKKISASLKFVDFVPP